MESPKSDQRSEAITPEGENQTMSNEPNADHSNTQYTNDVGPTDPVTQSPTSLGVLGLVREAFRLTVADGALFGWYILSYILSILVMFGVFAGAGYMAIASGYTALIFVGLLGFVLGFVLVILVTLALLSTIVRDDVPTFKAGLRYGRRRLWPFLILGLLSSLVLMGGYFLLIIPGIIVMGYLTLAQIVFIKEEQNGLDALTRSTALVKGHWWGTVGRLLLLSLIIIVGSVIIEICGNIIGGAAGEIVVLLGGMLVQGLGVIFILHGMHLWYQELVVHEAIATTTSARSWYIGLAWLGGVVMLLIPLSVVVLLNLNNANDQTNEAKERFEQQQQDMLRMMEEQDVNIE